MFSSYLRILVNPIAVENIDWCLALPPLNIGTIASIRQATIVRGAV